MGGEEDHLPVALLQLQGSGGGGETRVDLDLHINVEYLQRSQTPVSVVAPGGGDALGLGHLGAMQL